MDEGNKIMIKVPLLILPDRGLAHQTEVNVITHQKSGKTYSIPLLILPKVTSTANSTSSGASRNGYEDSLSDASDAHLYLNGKREELSLGKTTDETIENVDNFDVECLKTHSGR